MIGYGNITGLSGGVHYPLSHWMGIDAIAGVEMPYSPIFSAPYEKNQLSTSLRLRFTHSTGIYLLAGWFGGFYETGISTTDIEITETFFMQAPLAGIGFSWPPEPADSRIMIELGILKGLPEEHAIKADGYFAFYTLNAKRAKGINASLFPFLTFLFQF
jgi:hypothetical protein